MTEKHPDKEECMRCLKEHSTPAHVIRHCRAVTEAAMKIAGELNRCGHDLNLELIQAAGLLHDVLRVENNHDLLGAELVENMGYEAEADIIRDHMKYSEFNSVESLTEKDIVCMADRIVREDEYVGVDRRMEYILKKIERRNDAAAAKTAVAAKMEEMKRLISQIETIIGMSMDELMNK